jgi:hypothetical protein
MTQFNFYYALTVSGVSSNDLKMSSRGYMGFPRLHARHLLQPSIKIEDVLKAVEDTLHFPSSIYNKN